DLPRRHGRAARARERLAAGGAAVSALLGAPALRLLLRLKLRGLVRTQVRAFGLVLVLLTLATALSNRGLYLPRSEIERLFSAPLARADLVRYRLVAGGMRSLVGGLVLGAFSARRMPVPA